MLQAYKLPVPTIIDSKSFQGQSNDGVFGFMTDDGLAATSPVLGSNANANRDFSDAGEGLTYFYVKPAAGTVFRIKRFLVTVRATGSLDAAVYGNGIVLVNGIRVVIGLGDPASPTAILVDLTGGLPVLGNADWGRYTLDLIFSSFGQGDEYLSARFEATENKAAQYDGVTLSGDDDVFFAAELHDDLTDLVQHVFFVQGVSYPSDLAGAEGQVQTVQGGI